MNLHPIVPEFLAMMRPHGQKSLTLSHLLGAALAAQVLSLMPLWEHRSSSSTILGRYSTSYGLALGLSVGISLVWLIVFLRRRSLQMRLPGLSNKLRYGAVAASGLMVAGLWLTSIEDVLQNYFALNWLLLTLVLLYSQPDRHVELRRWRFAMIAGIVLGLLPMLITVFTVLPYSPDEAHWADMSTNYFDHGGLYPRTWLEQPYLIKPGIGWGVAVYGWLLEHVAFSYRVGRVLNLAAYALAYLGIGLVANRLYGRAAAFVSVTFALLSQTFLQELDYRPDQQLPALSMFILFAALQGRYGGRKRFWHSTAGLLATLGMELHAASIIYAFGFSLYYGLEAVWKIYHERRWQALEPLVYFGLGAALGSGMYYILNVQSIGGLDVYLSNLVADRWNTVRHLRFLRWPYLLESIVVWGGLAYIVWRRNEKDRLFLGLLLCQLLGSLLLDTQGNYTTTYSAFYIVPAGTLLVDGFHTSQIPRGENWHSVVAQVTTMLMMMGLLMATVVDWHGVDQFLSSGQIPPSVNEQLGKALRPYTTPQDVILSTHELFWEFHRPGDVLVSFAAELYGTRRWNLQSPVELWQKVGPTVVIYVHNRMILPDTLQTYMDDQEFRVCHELTIAYLDVTIYRAQC